MRRYLDVEGEPGASLWASASTEVGRPARSCTNTSRVMSSVSIDAMSSDRSLMVVFRSFMLRLTDWRAIIMSRSSDSEGGVGGDGRGLGGRSL